MHMIHICWVLSVKKIIRWVSRNQKGSKSKVTIMLIHFWKITVPYGFISLKTLYSLRHVLKIVLKLTKSLHHPLRKFRTRRFFIEKAVWSNLTVFVMEILQEIVVHFSFDMIRTFVPFCGHTLSVEIQRHHRLKLPKHIRDMNCTSDESLLLLFFIAREIISMWSNLE